MKISEAWDAPASQINAHMLTQTYTHTHTHTHSQTHTNTHAHTHAHTYMSLDETCSLNA
jgi:hypothetical protein